MNFSKSDVSEIAPILLAVLGVAVVTMLIMVVVRYFAKTADQRKPRQQISGCVIEKTQRNAGLKEPTETWICIETQNMQRINLKLSDEKIPVCVGDRGSFEYGGQTLFGFAKEA